MYLWTVQSKQVLKKLLEDEKYYPDFDKSLGYGDMKQIYPSLLESFNTLNHSAFDGFVFCFYRDNTSGCEFETISDIYDYLTRNLAVTEAFNFWSEDYAILQFEPNSQVNIMPLDFNDVIKLSIGKTNDIERVLLLYPELDPNKSISRFNKDIYNVINFMNEGMQNPYTQHRSFIEAHYPCLNLSDIRGVYSNLNYTATKKATEPVLFDLPYEAQCIKTAINSHI